MSQVVAPGDESGPWGAGLLPVDRVLHHQHLWALTCR